MTNHSLKIAFVSLPNSLFSEGVVKSGSVIVNEQLIAYLKANGHQVCEFSPSESRTELRALSGFGNALMFQDLLRHKEEINSCDLLISTNYYGATLPEITIPQITIFHHCAKTLLSFINGEAEIIDSKNLKKWLKQFSRYGLAYQNDESLHDQIVSVLEQYASDHSAAVIAVSESIKGEIIDHYSTPETKIHVAHNSIPENWLKIKVEKDFSASQLNLINVTRMPASKNGLMMKGIDRVFEVMSKARGFNRKIVASTSNQAYKKAIADHLDNVESVFNLDHQEVSKAFLNAHVSIHCSRVESFGLTLIESMLMGNIVLVYPVGVAPEIIKHGENGFIVHSTDEILKTLKKLTSFDLKKISHNARETILEKMSPKRFGERYLEIFDKVL